MGDQKRKGITDEVRMLIIPAIDLKGGKCVRLEQGEMSRETVFSDRPADMARHWEGLGAEMLHLVDLDGAFSGNPENQAAIQAIRKAVAMPIELGGGIRSIERIREYLDLGIDRVILGTAAYTRSDLVSQACTQFPGRILVGIDARDGRVAIQGWSEQTDLTALDLARRCEKEGVAAIIYTDIYRDGMLSGVNLEATRDLARALAVPVIASGGMARKEDIEALLPLSADGVMGVIIGRALYDGRIDLVEAIRIARSRTQPS